MIAGDPYQGGATWAVLHYLLGLRELGHEVTFVEPVRADSWDPPDTPLSASRNAEFFRTVMSRYGFDGSAALLIPGTRETVGATFEDIRKAARQADLLINVSGMLTDDELLEPIPTRLYLDLDPAFVQSWHTVEGIDMRFDGHTHFATVGNLIGRPECAVPTCGLPWTHTLPPVFLRQWPMSRSAESEAFTTIANWRGYGSIHHEGVLFGQKAHSLRSFFELPALTGERFELALAIHPNETRDIEALGAYGWRLLDPSKAAGTPDRYRDFIQQSRAEFGVAKSGYVVSHCGWFSDRSACYLASGRPVVAQETGFSDVLPTGRGLFSFNTTADFINAAHELRLDYELHAQAARDLAEAYFDSSRVLTRL